jgi:hypothetical protein
MFLLFLFFLWLFGIPFALYLEGKYGDTSILSTDNFERVVLCVLWPIYLAYLGCLKIMEEGEKHSD